MNIHEYQAKELLKTYGVPVPLGGVAYSDKQAANVAEEISGEHWVVKAQIHAGARGKAGGVRMCRTYHEVQQAARELLGKRLVTSQTGPEGKPVQRVYIEVADPFEIIVDLKDCHNESQIGRDGLIEREDLQAVFFDFNFHEVNDGVIADHTQR